MIQDRKNFLQEAAGRTASNPVEISVRDLLSHWGAKRRGYWVVEQIERELAEHRIRADPPITEGWIDNEVALIPTANSTTVATTASDDSEPPDVAPSEVGLQVGMLQSANCDVVSVKLDDSLEKAQSLMMRHDFSQLAVMSGPRDLRGVVSWESIAQARIRDPQASLKNACLPSTTVMKTDDLLGLVPRIVDAGFVFVQENDRRITGIVTTADLSNQFSSLARPFFMLGEIERRIRRIVDRAFTSEELHAALDSSQLDRPTTTADDLTMGEYVHLLENPAHWEKLGWSLDRKVFVEALDSVRHVRNEVMHFSPDPLDDDDVMNMERFLKWIRQLS